MSLQQQLSLNSSDSKDAMFNSRLSRVVSKLFSRVVKAEEASIQPFASEDFDTEAIICCLDDALVACEKLIEETSPDSNFTAVRNLAKIECPKGSRTSGQN